MVNFYFSPDSVAWKIHREQALLLGLPRVLLLNIAHPLVAEGVHEHSSVFEQPIERLRDTINLTAAIIAGTYDEAMQAAQEINRAHGHVQGEVETAVGRYQRGHAYRAHDPDLLLWVHGTTVQSAILDYERFVGPLTAIEKQAYYDEMHAFAAVLGMPRKHMPETVADLYGYIDDQINCGVVVVGDKARAIAPYVLAENSPALYLATLPLSRLTIGLLRPDLRAQFGLSYALLEEIAFDMFAAGLRRSLRYLPDELRYTSHYLQARERLASAP